MFNHKTEKSPKQARSGLIILTIVMLFTISACGFVSDALNTTADITNEQTISETIPPIAEDNPSNDTNPGNKVDAPLIVEATHNSRVEVHAITIPQLYNREWTYEVYLPPDYDVSDISYPVIYLLDGEYAFNPPTETGGDYQIDETLDRLFYEGVIDGMIAVSLWHYRDYRWDVYSPWINFNMRDWVKPTNSEPIEGGEGFEFTQFIVETLKPEIDSRYRTLTDRENTAIGGFCRTAIIPVVAGLAYPEVFSMVFSMSPTVWLAENGGAWLSDNQFINYINNTNMPDDVRFFIHVGTNETSGDRPPIRDQNGSRITYPQAYVEGAEAMYTALLNNGVPQENLYFETIEGSAGGRDLWGSRFDYTLLWLMQLN